MKPTELHIGNIFQAGYVTAVAIEVTASGIGFDALDGSITVGLCDWSIAKPVEIDDSILERMGFEKEGSFWVTLWQYLNTFLYLKLMSVSNGYWVIISDREGGKINTCKLQYVHQLQNLYQALTLTDLTLKD